MKPWADLSDKERLFAARLQEAFAAMLEEAHAALTSAGAFLRTHLEATASA